MPIETTRSAPGPNTASPAGTTAGAGRTGRIGSDAPADLLGGLGFLGALEEAAQELPPVAAEAAPSGVVVAGAEPAAAAAAATDGALAAATTAIATDPALWAAWLRPAPDTPVPVLPAAPGPAAASDAAGLTPLLAGAQPVTAGVPTAAAPAASAAKAPVLEEANRFFGHMQAVLHKASGATAGAVRPQAADAASPVTNPSLLLAQAGSLPTTAHAGRSSMDNATALTLPAAALPAEGVRSAGPRGGAADMGTGAGNSGGGQGVAQPVPPETQALADAGGSAMPAVPFDDAMQVWNDGRVQNAELTVPGNDGNALSVSVSLAGLETQVDFRSDQADARAALAGSVGDLQQMLAAQGLSLGGVSVGTSSGSQAQGRQPGSGEQAPRGSASRAAAGTEAVGAVPAASTRRPASALDLYA